MNTAACYFLAMTLSCACIPAASQELPRHSYLGIQMQPLTADLRRLSGPDDSAGVLINEVFPRSSAAAAGFRKGDVLLRINDHQARDVHATAAYVGTQRSGSGFRYELIRNQERIRGASVLQAFPEEAYPDLDVVYTEAKSGTGLQRIIMTRPKSAKGALPLVVFIGGIGCYSLDAPADTGRSELRLLNTLARSGFATARLEKPGMGDGAGFSRACSSISFDEEAEAYVAAITRLKDRKDIAPDAVYVIGHSMGGVFAPMVAKQTAIRGIIAYGTLGSNFPEYLAKTRRTVAEAYDMAPDEADDYIRDFCECAGLYFAQRLSTAEAAAKKESCRQYLSVFDLRSRPYNDQLYAKNVPGLWKHYGGRVLLLWGESDFISSRHDHELLTAAINRYHSGSATLKTIPAADHGMHLAASFAAARTAPGPYNPEVGDVILSWLLQRS